jgi:hypothetical protein
MDQNHFKHNDQHKQRGLNTNTMQVRNAGTTLNPLDPRSKYGMNKEDSASPLEIIEQNRSTMTCTEYEEYLRTESERVMKEIKEKEKRKSVQPRHRQGVSNLPTIKRQTRSTTKNQTETGNCSDKEEAAKQNLLFGEEAENKEEYELENKMAPTPENSEDESEISCTPDLELRQPGIKPKNNGKITDWLNDRHIPMNGTAEITKQDEET